MSKRMEQRQSGIADLLGTRLNLQQGPSPRTDLSLGELARGVAELSSIYTVRRQDLSGRLLRDPILREAYLAYFLPANVAKVRSILREIHAHPASIIFLRPNPRVLDLGCGPGTQLLGFLGFWAEDPSIWDSLDCVAVDAVEANLRESQVLFDGFSTCIQEAKPTAGCRIHTVVADLTCIRSLRLEGLYDFILLGSVLNELFPEGEWLTRRHQLLSTVVTRWLAPQGFLILVEPALKETSRQLLQLRDCLLDSTDLKVYSPCVHSNHCPAVSPQNPRDWCHEDRSWQPPELIRQLDLLIGNRKDSLKFSYVVLSRLDISIRDARVGKGQGNFPGSARVPGLNTSNAPLDPVLAHRGTGPLAQKTPSDSVIWRVVSEVLEEKGKTSVFLCGEYGRLKATMLWKHASDANRALSNLDRGQVVRTEGLRIRYGNEARVSSDTTVTVEFGEP
jgi:ribosomal protein RSM22 (predicted rRNA methylase)